MVLCCNVADVVISQALYPSHPGKTDAIIWILILINVKLKKKKPFLK